MTTPDLQVELYLVMHTGAAWLLFLSAMSALVWCFSARISTADNGDLLVTEMEKPSPMSIYLAIFAATLALMAELNIKAAENYKFIPQRDMPWTQASTSSTR